MDDNLCRSHDNFRKFEYLMYDNQTPDHNKRNLECNIETKTTPENASELKHEMEGEHYNFTNDKKPVSLTEIEGIISNLKQSIKDSILDKQSSKNKSPLIRDIDDSYVYNPAVSPYNYQDNKVEEPYFKKDSSSNEEMNPRHPMKESKKTYTSDQQEENVKDKSLSQSELKVQVDQKNNRENSEEQKKKVSFDIND